MAKNITKSDLPQEPKRKSTAAEKGNTLEKYCSRCFSCYQQQVHIDATDATVINIVLKNIGNARNLEESCGRDPLRASRLLANVTSTGIRLMAKNLILMVARNSLIFFSMIPTICRCVVNNFSRCKKCSTSLRDKDLTRSSGSPEVSINFRF